MMIYFPSPKLAYYHIHKTGGTSFKSALRRRFSQNVQLDSWPHHPLAHYFGKLETMGVQPEQLTILTTIRDPLHHVVSIYHYWKQVGNPSRPNVQAAKTMPFRDFVAYYIASRLPDCRVYDELLFVGGTLPANVHVLRLENWREDLERLACPVASIGQLPCERKSKHQDPARYHDALTVRQIRDRYHWVYNAGFYPEPRDGCP